MSESSTIEQDITAEALTLLVDFSEASHSESPPIQLTICGYASVAKLLQEEQFDSILSIKDPKPDTRRTHIAQTQRRKSFERRCQHVLCLDFSDCSVIGCVDNSVGRSCTISPQEYHIAAIVEFARQLKQGSRVLVHCMAGVSRSTAAAMILLREQGYTHEKAFAEVIRVRAQAQPNTKMLYLYEKRKMQRVYAAPSKSIDLIEDERLDDSNEAEGEK